MLEILGKTNIDFMGWRKLAATISIALMVIAFASFAIRGIKLGVDFTGGTLVEVGYPEAVELEGIRKALEEGGFHGAVVQHFGTAREVLVRLPLRDEQGREKLGDEVLKILNKASGMSLELRRVERLSRPVLPAWGRDKRQRRMIRRLKGRL